MTQPSALGPSAVAAADASVQRRADAEPELKDVLVDLWQNLQKLVRQEVALAGAELDGKVQRLKKELFASAIGGALMLAGALALVAAVVLLLSLVLPAWAAALLTGVAAAGGGFALLASSKPAASDIIPERTIHSLEKDLQTFRESTK